MYIVVNNAGDVQFRKDDTQNTLIGSLPLAKMCEAVVYIDILDINDPSGNDPSIGINDQRGLETGIIRSKFGGVFILTSGGKDYDFAAIRFLLLMCDLITSKKPYVSMKLSNMSDDLKVTGNE